MTASAGVAMMGVSDRFKPDDFEKDPRVATDGKRFVFTKVPAGEIKKAGPHAVLVITCDGSAKTITYKDPNYGDVEIIVTSTTSARWPNAGGRSSSTGCRGRRRAKAFARSSSAREAERTRGYDGRRGGSGRRRSSAGRGCGS